MARISYIRTSTGSIFDTQNPDLYKSSEGYEVLSQKAGLSGGWNMSAAPKPVVRKTPNAWHLYKATLKGYGSYGWGDTPNEARAKLAENIAKSGEKEKRATYGSLRD